MATIFTYITLLLSSPLPLQKDAGPDSLQVESFDYLYERIEEKAGHPAAWQYIIAYLDKAKRYSDWEELSNAYHYALYESKGNDKLVYADSMVYAAEQSGRNEVVGAAYLTRGIVCYNRKELRPALDNFVEANKCISRTNDPYLVHKLKYHLALIKLYLGYYNEAVALLRPCVAYFKGKNPEAYVNALHSLSICYSRLGKFAEAQSGNRQAARECRRLGVKQLAPFIELQKGINLFHSTRYREAVTTITASRAAIIKHGDFANLAIAHFYIGKSYWRMGDKKKAVAAFKKVDSIFLNEHYIRPDLREGYELLINYYSDAGKATEAIAYINRLLAIEKNSDAEFVYLSQKVHKDYDTRALVDARDAMQRRLRKETYLHRASRWAVVLLVIACLSLLCSSFVTRRRNKRKFAALMSRLERPAILPVVAREPRQEVNPEIIQRVIQLLEAFEANKGFLQKDITATALAEEFKTNYKYLSQVIHEHRNASFTEYINGLRITYILARLKAEPKLRRYHTPGLADESGFVTAQHFTETFRKVTGMTPVAFIRELEKRGPAGGKD